MTIFKTSQGIDFEISIVGRDIRCASKTLNVYYTSTYIAAQDALEHALKHKPTLITIKLCDHMVVLTADLISYKNVAKSITFNLKPTNSIFDSDATDSPLCHSITYTKLRDYFVKKRVSALEEQNKKQQLMIDQLILKVSTLEATHSKQASVTDLLNLELL